MERSMWQPLVTGPEAIPVDVSDRPRGADIAQLQAAYVMHRQECGVCTPSASCETARRLEEARRVMPV